MGLLRRRTAPVPIKEAGHRRLNSWKEIAAYLSTSVRTVQRWEQAEQLPVRRHEHGGGGTVCALTQELDAWLAGRTKASELPEPPPPRRRVWWGIGIAILTIGAGIGVLLQVRRSAPVASLAVLPFVNEGGDPNTEYLSAGLPESITRGLSRLSGFHVKVISQRAVERTKRQHLDAQEAGRLLNAEAVLTGRVAQRGSDLTVSVELIDVRDNAQIWGERFDRKFADVIAVQEQIAHEIAARLRLRLSPPQKADLERRPTASPEAHRNYLRGRYHWNRRSEGGLKLAIDYFQKAIDEDPVYGLAYAGLAESYAVFSYYAPADNRECAPKALAAAARALELDPSLSEAWTARGQVEADFHWNWAAAERSFRKAIELNERNADAHHWYSEFLGALGRFDDQRREVMRAAQLDPLSPIITNNQGHVHFFARRYAEAAECYRKATAEFPHFANPHKDLGRLHLAEGKPREAVAELERAAALGLPPMEAGLLALAYRRAGDAARALPMERDLAAKVRAASAPSYTMIYVELGLGDRARALDWLEKALEERGQAVKWIGVDPLFDPLRGEPRFQTMLRHMGLPMARSSTP
jgi:TolB-like protein/Tfp pilus assembly protein PilF